MRESQNLQTGDGPPADWMPVVRTCVETMAYGVIEITVHDGRVVQVEKRERLRMHGPASHSPTREA